MVAIVIGFLFVTLSLWISDDKTCQWLSKQKTVLILTAHPDDECMFFGPVITALLSKGVTVQVLCLSSGDWYGQGDVRVKEFFASCRTLGISRNASSIIYDPQLPDNPDIDWNITRIQTLVQDYVKDRKVTTLITFDDKGVSGHRNHISLHNAVQSMNIAGVPKYKLVSVPVFRKYSSVFDIFTSNFFREKMILTPFQSFFRPYRAMFEHSSQLVWFRYSYLGFSRYMFLNTIEILV